MPRAFITLSALVIMQLSSCQKAKQPAFTGANHEVKILTLNPGHFHAALVQKEMYQQVDPLVHIYAPEGPDANLHLRRIEAFNTRESNPTSWENSKYLGDDYLARMIAERKGNVVVIAGNNSKKTSYIYQAVDAGFNVLSDKPMAIDRVNFDLLKEAFAMANERGVLLYDIMTERYEITSKLQRQIAQVHDIFGELEFGSPENPAVIKESVHHLYKYVAGSVLQRPPWYFDIAQQGEGIVDVTTHLVDLIQWICFPDTILNYSNDVDVYSAQRWPTGITQDQFLEVTGLEQVPEYLNGTMDSSGNLQIFANGEINYSLKGMHAKVIVRWDYAAPQGGADTHYSLMRGTRSNLIIRQGKEQGYVPFLFIEPTKGMDREEWMASVEQGFISIAEEYPGVKLIPTKEGFLVDVPNSYRLGHEANFARVTQKYLQFLVDGELPKWEIPNMLAKYYTTTKALEVASGK